MEAERIDISLRSPRHDWLLFVENKITAGFQRDQLRRYKQMLQSRKSTTSPPHALILLTLEKKYQFTPDIDPDVHLTYQDDVVAWLETAVKQLSSYRVRANVEQYLQIVRNLGGTETMGETDTLVLKLGCVDGIPAMRNWRIPESVFHRITAWSVREADHADADDRKGLGDRADGVRRRAVKAGRARAR